MKLIYGLIVATISLLIKSIRILLCDQIVFHFDKRKDLEVCPGVCINTIKLVQCAHGPSQKTVELLVISNREHLEAVKECT